MSYGVKYQCTFDPKDGGSVFFKPRYRLEILQKDYTGTPTNVIGGETPVLHSWDTDDTEAPVRGSSLSFSFINKGSLPLKNFFSVNDDEFKVRLYWLEVTLLIQTTDRLLFEGFLVQDDCSEIMVDFTHVINLTATDGLGLLKDVALDKAPGNYEPVITSREPYEILYSPTAILLVSVPFGQSFIVGDKVSINGGTQYLITSIVAGVNVYNLYLAGNPPATSSTTGDISIYRYSPLLDKISLLSVTKRCISSTGLELNTHIYCNLLEINHFNTSSFLDQTLIDVQAFLKSDVDYDDCYSILEKVMERFKLSLFQAEGVWNIVRWSELRYYTNLTPGYNYDSNFTLVGPVTLDAALNAGIGEDSRAEYGLLNRISRPFKFAKETFNYRQPVQLLRNFNLQQLGTPIRGYTSGSGANLLNITEYYAPWWYYTNSFPTAVGSAGAAEYFIRVTNDLVGTEIERSLIVRKNSIHSYKIEVNKDDYLKFSFSFRTSQTLPGPSNLTFFIKLTDGTTTKYVKGNNLSDTTTWENTVGYVYQITSGDNAREWHTVNIISAAIPFDGLVYCYLSVLLASPNETLYKDIRLEYTPLVNGSSKIKGQTHTSTQTPDIKHKQDEEIFMDTTPKHSVVGTLFLSSMTGLLQKLTTRWLRGHMVTGGGLPMERRKLGDITTYETLFQRSVPRTILEGSYRGLLHNNKHKHISLLTTMKYTHSSVATCNFVWGKLEIDYKHDKINNSPLWEQYKDGEAEITADYEHKYIYETK